MADHDHMCAWNCGNIADNVLVNLNTSEADILCTPCFLRLANDISQAWLKELEEKGLTEAPKAAIVDGSTVTLSGAAGEIQTPELSAPSTGTLSGSVSSDSTPVTEPPPSDDPPEYEPPDALELFGTPNIDTGDTCPTCHESDSHAPGCIFA